jgi:hypothetical protein
MRKLYITVLSKNRSLQFQSLIDSLFLNIKKYYPLTIKVLYNDKDDDHFFNPNAYRKLKSSYEHIEFKNVEFDDTFNIHEYFIKDELNLFLTDNILFTLPLDLYEIGSIDFDNSVLDLFKGINRQKNTNNTYRYDAHKWKQDNKLYYIESGKIKVYKTSDGGKELIIGLLSAGDFFGHIPLIENVVYDEFAETLEESSIRVIPKKVSEYEFGNMFIGMTIYLKLFEKFEEALP